MRVVTPNAGQIRTSWSDVMTDLARIEDQPAGTSTGWTEGVDAGERIIAFVHSSNFDLLSVIAAMSRTGSDVAAVVLEGFMPGDDAQHAVNMLAAVGASAMSCRLGELSRAMRTMEQGISADGHQAQRTASAAQAASVDVATEERAA